MRKFFAFLLVLALCLSMAACGKSEAVKAVETMIDALGTVTEDSADAIYAIDDAYAALAEEEQGKVKNYKNFLKAKEAYYEMTLAGIWYPCDLNPADLEHNFSPRFYIELNADMTMISKSDFRGTSAGIWDVSEGNDLFFILKETFSKSSGIEWL